MLFRIMTLLFLLSSYTVSEDRRAPSSLNLKNLNKNCLDRLKQIVNTENREFSIGVDLGGTKTAIGAVTKEKEIIFKTEIPTHLTGEPITSPEDRENFLKRISKEITNVIKEIEKQGYQYTHIGIGSPGLLTKGIIAPGTAQQLGAPFYNFNIEEGFRKYLNEILKTKVKIKVKNDSIAQFSFALHNLSDKERKLITGEKIGFISSGTSLGGGFANLRKLPEGEVNIQYYTDGHIFDLMIGNELAHDIASGRYFKKELKLSGKKIQQDLIKHQEYVRKIGQNIGKVIERIYLADFKKAEGYTPWSEEDYNFVKGIKSFILGGSIPTKGEMGKMVQSSITEYLWKKGFHDIHIIPVKGNTTDAGIIGAASF